MGFRRAVIRRLDRPGGRWLLGAVGTWYARKACGPDARVFYNGAWGHRVGADQVADTPRFLYSPSTFRQWRVGHLGMDDPSELWFHVYKPTAGDTIIDIGAGNGSDLPTFSRAVGASGLVVAIEAHPATYAWNGLANVRPIEAAAADRPGTLFIDSNEDHAANSVKQAGGADARGTPVCAHTVDELLSGISKIDFLKMNIEGAERLAMVGMPASLKRSRAVCIACHDFLARDGAVGRWYRTRAEVIETLTQAGFSIVERRSDPRPYVRDHIHGFRK